MKLSISKLAQNDSVEYSEFKKDKYLKSKRLHWQQVVNSYFKRIIRFPFLLKIELSNLKRVLFPKFGEIGKYRYW